MDREDLDSGLQSQLHQVFHVALDLLWSLCSPFLDSLENNVPFLPLAALCQVHLSCWLLKTSPLSTGLHGAQHCSLSVSCQPGEAQPGHHHVGARWASLAGSLQIRACVQEMCEPSFPAMDFSVVLGLQGAARPQG